MFNSLPSILFTVRNIVYGSGQGLQSAPDPIMGSMIHPIQARPNMSAFLLAISGSSVNGSSDDCYHPDLPNTARGQKDFPGERLSGSHGVITGATDGIGKAYAKALAKKGINVILVSRTLSKLEDVAKEIETESKVQTKIIAVDFTSGPSIYDEIRKQTAGLEIGILVNNVGISYPNPEYFLNIQEQDKLIENLINCNIFSVTRMCQLFMPGMVERRKGVVINISSLSAIIAAPLLTVYAASKAFMDKFSDDLATEYAKHGIIVQSILPGPVATNMSKIRRSTWMACSPKTFASNALNTLGIARHSTGYYPHALFQLGIDFLAMISPSVSRKLTLKTMENIRARAIKKAAGPQKQDTK
ncbi:very-long-chain 3-oxoacyl-CoA reductase-like [Uranotaenia lowii]|uniref:very-long-chain 3-oxoacyl-CoA reductase-like n=1 Tax=Uranotaenia lowii TaxID=190385 RepID=UPI00247A711D|nr:very-long-chain 3-oxoacyl-CoA reductase-like [Uranotaenia lowii]